MAQHSTNSIWSYIQKRGNTYWFYKRWSKPLISVYGQFDRQSLKTKVPREAELEAAEFLEIHEAKAEAALAGKVFHDLTRITKLTDIPRPCRKIIFRYINSSREFRAILEAPAFKRRNYIPEQYAVMDWYEDEKNRDGRDYLFRKLVSKGILFKKTSEVFDKLLTLNRREGIRFVALVERGRRLLISQKSPAGNIKKIDTLFIDPSKEPDDVGSRPAPKLSVFADLYKTQYTTGRGGKPLSDKNKAQIATVLRWAISAFDDQPINRIKSEHIIQFFNDLVGFPAGHHLMKNNTRSFREMIELKGEAYEKKLSRETAKDYWQILNKFFQKAMIKYRDSFTISNPMEGLKMDDYVKGRESKETRAWFPDEISNLFSHDKFSDTDFDNQFAWCTLFGLFHGNRVSELTRREVDSVKFHANGIWYLDVPKGGKTKNAERMIPIHDFLLKIGFLDYVAYRKAQGKQYLFDPTFANSLSSAFKQWLERKGLYDPARTFHQLRSSWVTASERIEMREAVARYIAGHVGADLHDAKYKSTWLDTTKKAMDQIVIDGFPYDQFKIAA